MIETMRRLAKFGFMFNKVIDLAHKAVIMTMTVNGRQLMAVINHRGEVIRVNF